MTPLDIFLILASISVAILTAVLVPTLLQLKRTCHEAETTLRLLEKELPPMTRKITAVAAELELLAVTCNVKAEEADAILRTARRASETLLLTSQILKESVRPIISGIGGLGAGLQMFGRVLLGDRRNR